VIAPRADQIMQTVPEHFIWHLFSQLTEALIAFKTGACDEPILPEVSQTEPFADGDLPRTPSVDAADSWEPLLHSDIKPQNIFCCDENRKYASYPRPVLSDFDLSPRRDNRRQLAISRNSRVASSCKLRFLLCTSITTNIRIGEEFIQPR
jgi:serine/threonine protein kinase